MRDNEIKQVKDLFLETCTLQDFVTEPGDDPEECLDFLSGEAVAFYHKFKEADETLEQFFRRHYTNNEWRASHEELADRCYHCYEN